MMWLLGVIFLSVCSAQIHSQADLDNLAKGLQITWNVITNTKDDYGSRVEVTLKNLAPDLNLTNDQWQLHFSCPFRIEPELLGILGNKEVELPGQDVTVTHLQGDLFYFKPTDSFIPLNPGATRKIKLKLSDSSVARTDSFPNWYLAFQSLPPAAVTSTEGEDLAFVADRVTVQQWKRSDDDEYNPYTPQERYERNYVADSSYSSEIRLIPKPASIKINDVGRQVKVNETWIVTSNGTLDSLVVFLTNSLNITNKTAVTPGSSVIHLTLGDVDTSETTIKNSPDVYSLSVTSSRIDIVGKGISGIFYGIVTLLNLMDESQRVPECFIVDGPRFEYRGLMLDIARSFHSKDDIMGIIELMSTYKLNKLHLHLSDDEGWRIEIPSLPELTEFGSRRCHDPSETICLMPHLGSGLDNSTKYGSGFLTTSDYVDILEHANKYYVTVIPEIEMPGHGRAAILSMKVRNQSSTFLTEDGDMSQYTTPQMYSDNAINPCLESTYNFISIVMDEFIKLHNRGHQPLDIFHFGGDEVGQGAWVNSSKCQALRESGNLTGHSYKQYLFKRVSKLAASKNLSLGAWEDGLLHNGSTPFDLSESAVKNVLGYAWNSVSEDEAVGRTYTLANQGYKVVLTHASHLYMDHPYEPDPEERGTYWATRFTDTKKLFSYNAENYYDNFLVQLSGAPISHEELCGVANESCPPLTSLENVIGMEGTVFSETTRTRDHLHHNLFPRLIALAERAWHHAPWEDLPRGDERDKQLNEDWFSFARSVGYRELPRLEKKNVAFRIPPPGAVVSFGRLLTTPLYPGLIVQYSFDAGNTWQDARPSVPLGDYNYRIWLRTRTANSQRFSRTVILQPTPPAKIVNQPVIDYIGDNLGIQYTVVGNYLKNNIYFFEAKIRFTNLGKETIPGGNWRIYFVSVNPVEPTYILEGREYVDSVAKITISHTSGYLYSVGPSPDFPGIAANGEIEFIFKVQAWSVSRYEQMPRWYVSSPGMKARNLKYTDGEDLAFVSPFTRPEQWKRFDFDKFDPWTPGTRYDRNLAWEVHPQRSIPVIPTPVLYDILGKQIVNLLQGSWTVAYGHESLKNISLYFKETMSRFFPQISLEVNSSSERNIHFSFDPTIQSFSNNTEAYKIQVHGESKTVEVSGISPDGVFYGAVTLIQTALKSSPAGSLPEYLVKDWPRFSYRGMHVDTGRNFVPKNVILKLLDVMSLYKLNKLHFHLSDDEGWRLQIPGFEELTEIGGRRCHDLEETECVMSTLGSGADNSTSGTGFYTVEDYQEILQHAENLHIDVIPEFDMPGHAHSSIRAMMARQARLRDLGDHEKCDEFVLNDENDTSYYHSIQFYTDNAVNPCIESTYRFINELYTRVKEIHEGFQPLKVYHFGGDEVAQGAWINSIACAELIRAGVSLKREFTRRVSQITKDVSLAAWEDGLMDHDSIPWNRSDLVNKDVIVNAWQNVWEWGVSSRAYNLANRGYKVVFSPVTHMYFDHPQEPTPEERGFYWGTRYTDAFKSFSFMPDNYFLNADIKRSGEPITLAEICGKDNAGCPSLEKPENILGLQGQLWSETIRLPEELYYMVFPRLLALAERAWHKAPWEGKEKAQRDPELKSDWARFANSLGDKDLGILDRLNISYRVPPPGVRQTGYTLSAKVEFPGLRVQYRIKNSNWENLDQSVTFKVGQEVMLRTVSADGKRFSSEVQVTVVKVPSSKSAATVLSIPVICMVLVVISYCFM